MSNFVLEKNTINNVVVTVSERSQLANPYFLIVFTNKFAVQETTAVCSVQNQAVSNPRYDLFVISETSPADNLSGEVYLIEGEWSYKVYESSVQTLDVNATTGRILQRGFIVVKEQIGN
jgi:hypothetical protein